MVTVTQERIDKLISQSEVQYFRIFDTGTIAAVRLPNGFKLVGQSACVDPDNYDADMGNKIALEDAKRQLWALEGYLLKDSMKCVPSY
jgi:hypothetical protein